jgi:L-ascorbate metabolism protein UlaG (beta-lactamase superfamily)
MTHIGAATLLIEIGPLRLLTDPAFDPPGGRYRFGFGVGSVKTAGPAIAPEALGRIDAVLLSHDHHGDNLDAAGRALLPRAGRVLTTPSGARRLGGNALGLAPWATTEIVREGARVEITATPARHGPIGSRPIVGEVVGFVLRWDGQRRGPLYISGDTVFFRGVEEVGRRFRPAVAVLHLGGVRFAITGPLRYTLDGADAVRAARALGAGTIIPIHYEGWEHFREPRAAAEHAFAAAGLGGRVRWLPIGQAVEVEV